MSAKLIHLVLQTIEMPWDWGALSANPNITQEDIEHYIQYPWVWAKVSENPNLDMAFVVANLDYDWNWEALSKNRSLTVDQLMTYKDFPWNWFHASRAVQITIDQVLSTKLPWNWAGLSANRGITVKDVLAHPEIAWDWFYVTYNDAFDFQNVLDHPEAPWDWHIIHSDRVLPTLTKELLDNPAIPWKIDYLSAVVPLELIDACPDKEWHWANVSRNPNLTVTYVMAHPEIPWDWDAFNYSLNIGGQLSRIKHLPHWNWTKMAYNPHLTAQDILENPELPLNLHTVSTHTTIHKEDLQVVAWAWPALSSNPNLRLDFIRPELPWDWPTLSCHRFGL
jgi:hypothetical protein